eukprot:Pgem_evm1s13213
MTNNVLGKIAIRWLVLTDLLGAEDDICCELAIQQAIAVDSPKSGIEVHLSGE